MEMGYSTSEIGACARSKSLLVRREATRSSTTGPIFARNPTLSISKTTETMSKCVTMLNVNQGFFDACVNVSAVSPVSSWACS
jgi:hypothetical protein